MMKEDLEVMGPVRLRDVEAAQQTIHQDRQEARERRKSGPDRKREGGRVCLKRSSPSSPPAEPSQGILGRGSSSRAKPRDRPPPGVAPASVAGERPEMGAGPEGEGGKGPEAIPGEGPAGGERGLREGFRPGGEGRAGAGPEEAGDRARTLSAGSSGKWTGFAGSWMKNTKGRWSGSYSPSTRKIVRHELALSRRGHTGNPAGGISACGRGAATSPFI